MELCTVSFFGHRAISHCIEVERQLELLLKRLLKLTDSGTVFLEFLVGREGAFDQLVSSAIRRCRRAGWEGQCSLTWVLPYETVDLQNNRESFLDYYDEIEICEAAAAGHFRGAYQTRNREMVDRSDLVVFCVERASGGAWQTLQYAKKTGKPWLNLAPSSPGGSGFKEMGD